MTHLAAWELSVLFLELGCCVGPIKTVGIWLLPQPAQLSCLQRRPRCGQQPMQAGQEDLI